MTEKRFLEERCTRRMHSSSRMRMTKGLDPSSSPVPGNTP